MRNIYVPRGHLSLGTSFFGFADNRTPSFLHVRGKLTVGTNVRVGTGSRWDIGPNSKVDIGDDTYFSPDTLLISSTAVSVGTGCAISWQTQILDDDFHTLEIDSVPRNRSASVIIGNRVWIGTRCIVLKGSEIADGCVVAAGSVIAGEFAEPNCLIGGVPAKIIRHNVRWATD